MRLKAMTKEYAHERACDIIIEICCLRASDTHRHDAWRLGRVKYLDSPVFGAACQGSALSTPQEFSLGFTITNRLVLEAQPRLLGRQPCVDGVYILSDDF